MNNNNNKYYIYDNDENYWLEEEFDTQADAERMIDETFDEDYENYSIYLKVK